MNRNETDRKYRETMEGAPERFAILNDDAASLLRDSSWSSIAGLQEYNEKLFEMAQDNINMTLDFFRRTARTRSPSEFITVASEHARRQYETSTEQARELTALAQRLALGAAKPMSEHAGKILEKAA